MIGRLLYVAPPCVHDLLVNHLVNASVATEEGVELEGVAELDYAMRPACRFGIRRNLNLN